MTQASVKHDDEQTFIRKNLLKCHLIFKLFNSLNLKLEKIVVVGFGEFVVHSSKLDVHELSFDLDISIPRLDINCGQYILL